jgi:hypothetical protein
MGECSFIVNKHELQVFKQYFDVNIKLINNLIHSMTVKGKGKYSFRIKNNEALLEIMKDFRVITEDHLMLGEDMILNLDYSMLEDLIKHLDLILSFCRQKESMNTAGLENIRRMCCEGIGNVEILAAIHKRMKLTLYMNNSYSA